MNEQPIQVLFIDDLPYEMGYAIDFLRNECNCDVTLTKNVSDSIDFIEQHHERIDVIILDMGLPVKETEKERFNEVINRLNIPLDHLEDFAGAIIYSKTKELIASIPIIVYTINRNSDPALKAFENENIVYLNKMEYPGSRLCKKIREILSL